jgi:hypothetical protein
LLLTWLLLTWLLLTWLLLTLLMLTWLLLTWLHSGLRVCFCPASLIAARPLLPGTSTMSRFAAATAACAAAAAAAAAADDCAAAVAAAGCCLSAERDAHDAHRALGPGQLSAAALQQRLQHAPHAHDRAG